MVEREREMLLPEKFDIVINKQVFCVYFWNLPIRVNRPRAQVQVLEVLELRTPHWPNHKQWKPPGRAAGVSIYFAGLSACGVCHFGDTQLARVCAWNTSRIRQWAIALAAAPRLCMYVLVCVFGLYWITAWCLAPCAATNFARVLSFRVIYRSEWGLAVGTLWFILLHLYPAPCVCMCGLAGQFRCFAAG